MVLGFQLVMTSLLVTLGRIADIVGRVRMYNLGFLIFTAGSILLTFTPGDGNVAAIQLICYRLVQAVGAAFLFGNSAAILTDAFPPHQRGLALGLNQVSAFAGQILGLVAGGLLSAIDYRLVFFVSVPIGVAGWLWARLQLRELAVIRRGQRIDLPGNFLFVAGLGLILVAASYGQQPYAGQPTGWRNPAVEAALVLGILLLAVFTRVELRVPSPMFRLSLFRNRMFAAANVAGLLAAIGRGGLQFMLIIWLQGIWLPLHGYRYDQTPLWAGIYLLPMIAGILLMGPISGVLSDRFGARGFSTAGMLLTAAGFMVLSSLPIDFPYPLFAATIFGMGVAQGLFAAPNSTSIMNSLPAGDRGSGAGIRSTFQQAGMLTSQALFFSIVIVGLSSTLPESMRTGLIAVGVPPAGAAAASALPPSSALFSAFLGYNPMQHLLSPPLLASLSETTRRTILAPAFFPNLIGPAFGSGLALAFRIGAGFSILAAVASLLRGGRFIQDGDLDLDL